MLNFPFGFFARGLQFIDQLIDFEGSYAIGELLVNNSTLRSLFKGQAPYSVFQAGNGSNVFTANYIGAASKSFQKPFMMAGVPTYGAGTRGLRRDLSSGSYQDGISIYFRDNPYGTCTCVTLGCFINSELDPINFGLENWDLLTFYTNNGFGVAVQQALSASEGNSFRAHGGNPTTFGPRIYINQAQWYWVTSEFNSTLGSIKTSVYNVDTHVQVGETSTASTSAGGIIYVLLLNNTVFERNGYNIYYDNIVMKFDSPGTFPLLPW